MTTNAILFDLDGTLLDTLADIADSANAVLRERGLPTHPIDAYRHFVGEGVTMLITRMLPQDRRDPATIEQCSLEYRAQYAKNWNTHTCLYPGIADLLDALLQRRTPLSVLSNKPHEFTIKCVQAYVSRWPFAVVLGQSDSFPRKPDPSAALEIARRLHLPPSQFLYVGDTATDMQTARAAGMTSIGALWGFREAEELKSAGARDLIVRPGELLKFLGR